MSHVKYDEWLKLIVKIVKKYSKGKNVEILELGAGTGILGKKLIEHGYHYRGLDLSFSMAEEARLKRVPVFCADACSIPVNKKYDLIIFLYDGINYLPSLKDYNKVFVSVANCLSDGGLFLFDITTETNSFRYFYDIHDIQEINGSTIIRHSYFNPKTFHQYNDFTIFIPVKNDSSMYLKREEHHKQKIFNPEKIRNVIPTELFSCLGIWDGYSMKKCSRYSERVHFLLEKK
jgi:SAM-dependent methyltransferase